MHRKWSNGQGRRSSAPKRFSVIVPEPEDRSNKNASDGKKSFIPRPTVGTSRSSSVERDGARSFSRATGAFAKSTSVEHLPLDENPKTSDFRSRSTENLNTPKHLMKTPATKASRNTVSVQKTVRKDTRPLTDKAFQNIELVKVEEYLVAKEIIRPGQNLCNSMTLKLFVHIMNSLLGEFFSCVLNLSNYTELIPLFMRKLKYPGNITRSWLVTANSPHTWPNVLGLLSWLVDLINLQLPDMEFVVDDDSVIDSDQAKKLYEKISQKYLEWVQTDIPFSRENYDRFYDDLVQPTIKPLEDQLSEAEKEAQELEVLKRQSESSEENNSDHKLKIVKMNLEKKTLVGSELQNKVKTLQNELEKTKNEMQKLSTENNELHQCIADYGITESLNVGDVAALQSELVALENVFKLQETHITNINNQCYSLDLVNARLQGKVEEVRLQRDAVLRGCVSENINPMELSLRYENQDNSRILAEYLAYVKERNDFLDNISRECSEEENSNKAQTNEAEEKLKVCEADIFNEHAEIKSLQLQLAEIEDTVSGLKKELRGKKEYSQINEEEASSKHTLELRRIRLSELQEEFKVFDNSFIEQKEKYERILKRMCDILVKHFERCQEVVYSCLRDDDS